jgi:hypothetical protein
MVEINSFLIKDLMVQEVLEKKQILVFSFTFLLLQKSNKKRAPKSNTARFREAALFGVCTTVASALVILLLGTVSLH